MSIEVIGSSAVSEAGIQKIRKDNADYLSAYHPEVMVGLRHVKILTWLPVKSSNGKYFIGSCYMQLSTNGNDSQRRFTYFKNWEEVERSWLGA